MCDGARRASQRRSTRGRRSWRAMNKGHARYEARRCRWLSCFFVQLCPQAKEVRLNGSNSTTNMRTHYENKHRAAFDELNAAQRARATVDQMKAIVEKHRAKIAQVGGESAQRLLTSLGVSCELRCGYLPPLTGVQVEVRPRRALPDASAATNQLAADVSLVLAAAHSGLPAYAFTRPSLRRALSVRGGVEIPAAGAMADLQNEVYDVILNEMHRTIISSGNCVNLNVDYWKHKGRSSLGITAHYVDQSWCLRCVQRVRHAIPTCGGRSDCVGLIPVGNIRHTADNTVALVENAMVLPDNTLIFSATTDNATVMRNAGDSLTGGRGNGIG